MQQNVEDGIRSFFGEDDNSRLVILFGSTAKGTASRNSDVDVAVQFAAPPSSLELLEMRTALERRLGRDVDLISLNNAGPVIKMQILKTGIVIRAEKNASELFFVRTVNEYDDIKRITAPNRESVIRRRIYGRA